ncbi:hypothetical protein M8013_10835 [Enterobacteriaceae bacterium H4N4]|uniref:Uncharacterized protein n=1 Tax=Silvania confinis TaxID=2926470 RepID=A0A9J6QLV8_9ENTR|nr:hypothetical protein [Silvania confinis]MCU6669245.1 hypothetical protein [Silvania confinis]
MMSVIAQYHIEQQSVSTQPEATLIARMPSAGATQTSVPASLSQMNNSLQPMMTQPAASAPHTADTRPVSPEATPATLDKLDQFARSQGWSEQQIALMEQPSRRKNGGTSQPWSAQGGPLASREWAFAALNTNWLPTSPQQSGGIRGIRNNNPGNLEASWAFSWLGQNGTDGRFATFTSPEHGIRALGMNLLSYQRRGLDTISKIITRWAPPQDNNNTPAYIQKVSSALGVTPDTRLDVASPSVLSALSKAIIHQENGTIPFSEEVIHNGVFSALGLTDLSGSQRPVLTLPPVSDDATQGIVPTRQEHRQK